MLSRLFVEFGPKLRVVFISGLQLGPELRKLLGQLLHLGEGVDLSLLDPFLHCLLLHLQGQDLCLSLS